MAISKYNVKLTPIAIILTVLDGVLTTYWVTTGIAEEANPLLYWLIEQTNIYTAMILRVAAGIILLVQLDKLIPKSKLANLGMKIVTILLSVVFFYHMTGFFV